MVSLINNLRSYTIIICSVHMSGELNIFFIYIFYMLVVLHSYMTIKVYFTFWVLTIHVQQNFSGSSTDGSFTTTVLELVLEFLGKNAKASEYRII